jgi:hypothetical protein
VLTPTGALWLNIGDGYARHPRDGANHKSLLLAPERLALALTDDGWLLRNKVIWAKSNPMPSSVRDRLSCSYEVVYFFTRACLYFFDLDASALLRSGGPSHASATQVRSSDRQCELGEGGRQAERRWDVVGEFVVSAAEVLDERIPGGDHGD